MRFQSIELENYRQYKDKQTINFSQDLNKNFTILKAPNGAGKTNLLGAIYWCFYNSEGNFNSKYQDSKRLGILNETTLQEMVSGERAKVSVKIILGEKNHPEYILERVNVFEKNNIGLSYLINESFKIWVHTDGGFEEEPNKELAINRILPSEIKNFFFFDGEKLDAFFRIGSGTNVKKAVYDVSQIGLLNNTLKHLDFMKKDLLKNHKDLDPEINNIQKKIYDSEKSLLELQNRSDKLKKEIDDANFEINDIDQYLKDNPITYVKEKQNEREKLTNQLKENNNNIDLINEKRKELLIKIMPIIYLKNIRQDLVKKINELDNQGVIPPEISSDYLNNLIKKKKCICGTIINKNSKEEKNLLSLLKDIIPIPGNNASILIDGRAELSYSDERINEFKTKIGEYYKEITNLELKSKDIRNSLEEIKIKFENFDVEEISQKESKRTLLYNAVQQSIRSQSIYDQDITYLKSYISDNNKKWAQLSGQKSENKEIIMQISLLEESQQILNQILTEIVTEVRETIEMKTNEYFLNLIWKKEAYNNVKIDSEYNISILNKYNSECLESLSSGERQVLALSFMAALKEVSGFDVPVIIDTPLGRISGEPRENIAKSLPNYLKDTQVTLLMTDTEYTPQLKDILKGRVGKEYFIKFNDELSNSKVI